MKKIGFEFEEVMSGTYTLLGGRTDGGEVRLQAKAHAPGMLAHIKDGMVNLNGTLDMEHFADDVPISGTIEIRPFFKKIIRYDFSFVGNDGNGYRFAGQKDIRYANFVNTMTTLHGVFTDARGDEIAKATLHFDVKADLLPFLVSWKPAVT